MQVSPWWGNRLWIWSLTASLTALVAISMVNENFQLPGAAKASASAAWGRFWFECDREGTSRMETEISLMTACHLVGQ